MFPAEGRRRELTESGNPVSRKRTGVKFLRMEIQAAAVYAVGSGTYQ